MSAEAVPVQSGPEARRALRVLSLGGGTQSSGLALMSLDGVLPRLDAIVFADTQHEMPGTYKYLEFLADRADRAGVRFVRVSAGDLKVELRARQGRGMQPNLPVRVLTEDGELQRINAYRCSYDFKRRVIEAEVKRQCGGRGAWKRSSVEQWIGFTVDEASRMKPSDQCRCGHKRARLATRGSPFLQIHTATGCTRCSCLQFDPWQVNRWPLIDLQMTRGDVVRWIRERGYPIPPRSACYFCPNRGNAHWRELRSSRDVCADCDHHRGSHGRTPVCSALTSPGVGDDGTTPACGCTGFRSLWDSTIEVDEFVRHGMNDMRGVGYLHPSGVPLTDADLRPRYEQLRDSGVEPLFVDETDTDCEAGVCFT